MFGGCCGGGGGGSRGDRNGSGGIVRCSEGEGEPLRPPRLRDPESRASDSCCCKDIPCSLFGPSGSVIHFRPDGSVEAAVTAIAVEPAAVVAGANSSSVVA